MAKLDLKALLGEGKGNALKGIPVGLVVSGAVLLANLMFWGLGVPEIEAGAEALLAEQGQLNGQISTVDRKISELKKNIGSLGDLTEAYRAEQQKGTFEPENRLRANDILADVKTRHFPLSFFEPFSEYHLEIKPGAPYSFPADGKSQTWYASPVNINIEMLDDRSVYEFTADTLKALNGVSLFKSMSLERRPLLEFRKGIESKDKHPKVALPITAEIEFLWLTQEMPENANASKGKRR
ncbi:MAG: hypothetical protein EPN26_08330 [Rhodospirillales bacterium]|nr:MAG: hypothetical protein EPN26_08330 [Rhodospirillales bacterium]